MVIDLMRVFSAFVPRGGHSVHTHTGGGGLIQEFFRQPINITSA